MNKSDKAVTIYDISKAAGVSIATVSRVLNDSNSVKFETKQRVNEVMRELNYEPNAFARGLGTGSMKTIGILCADVADIFLANAVSFLERDLRKKGFDSILICTGYEYERKVASLKALESRKVDAVILVGSQYIELVPKKNDYIMETANNLPIMILNGFLKHENIFCTLSDDYTSFYEATLELLNSGCNNILFLYRELSYSRERKYKGYCDALRSCHKEIDPNLVLQSEKRIDQIKEQLKQYSKNGFKFDGVITSDDEIAMGVLKFANDSGIHVPKDLAIIGCNNSVLSICSNPELSSIDNKCELLCVNTVSSLMRVLAKKEVSPKTVISTEYVKRYTTK